MKYSLGYLLPRIAKNNEFCLVFIKILWQSCIEISSINTIMKRRKEISFCWPLDDLRFRDSAVGEMVRVTCSNKDQEVNVSRWHPAKRSRLSMAVQCGRVCHWDHQSRALGVQTCVMCGRTCQNPARCLGWGQMVVWRCLDWSLELVVQLSNRWKKDKIPPSWKFVFPCVHLVLLAGVLMTSFCHLFSGKQAKSAKQRINQELRQ